MSNKSGNFFQYEKTRWHFIKMGSGSKALFCFHGYGQTGDMFKPLLPALKDEYTLYAFHFIHHGLTVWNTEDPCTPEVWANMLDAFAKHIQQTSIDLMGFSMGGKMILHSIHAIKTPINKIYLIAMDGVELNAINDPRLNKKWIKSLAKKIILNASWVLSILPFLKKVGWINQQQEEFAHYYLATERRRKRAFMIWKSMLHFWQSLDKVVHQIQQKNIETHIFFGRSDKILDPSIAVQLHDKIPGSALHWVDGGHFIVTPSLNPIFQSILAKE